MSQSSPTSHHTGKALAWPNLQENPILEAIRLGFDDYANRIIREIDAMELNEKDATQLATAQEMLASQRVKAVDDFTDRMKLPAALANVVRNICLYGYVGDRKMKLEEARYFLNRFIRNFAKGTQ